MMPPGRWLCAPPRFGSGPGLHRIHALSAPLRADPAWAGLDALRVVGTDGKGSTCALLSAVLGALGLDVALFTSPHLLRVNERFRRGLAPIADAELAAVESWTRAQVEDWEARWPEDRVGAFERCTLALLRWVCTRPPQALVVEAGLGGRLDSTRALPGRGVGLCPVDLEHTALLGRTREDILADKLELVPDGGWVVLGRLAPGLARRARGQLEARGVQVQEAQDLCVWSEPRVHEEGTTARLRVLGEEVGEVCVGLVGAHQLDNAALALALAAGWWTRRGGSPAALAAAARRGLPAARWPGRMERLGPRLWVDLAHTPQGAAAAAAAGQALAAGRPLVWVGAASEGKELAPLLAPLAAVAEEIVWVQAQERGVPAAQLRALVGRGVALGPVPEGLAFALDRAEALGGVVLVAGSLFAGVEVLAACGEGLSRSAG